MRPAATARSRAKAVSGGRDGDRVRDLLPASGVDLAGSSLVVGHDGVQVDVAVAEDLHVGERSPHFGAKGADVLERRYDAGEEQAAELELRFRVADEAEAFVDRQTQVPPEFLSQKAVAH